MKKIVLGIIVLASLFVVGCQDEKDQSKGDYESGAFIIHQGNFNAGDASVSFKEEDKNSVSNQIFKTVNNRPLGDVGQSMSIFKDKAFLVVNNSNKVEVVDANTFKELATITDFAYPRYFLGINENKAYVTQWGSDGLSGTIKIINPSTNKVTGEIDVEGNGPERLELIDDKVYVSYSGGYSRDSFITVINPKTDAIEKTVATNYNPREIAKGADGNIWVLSSGYKNYSTGFTVGPKIQVLDKDNHSLVKELELSTDFSSVADLQKGDDSDLFFIMNKVIYKVNSAASNITTEAVISGKPFTTMTYDSDEDIIYTGVTPSYKEAGSLAIYKTDGTLKKEYTVGIAPSQIVIED